MKKIYSIFFITTAFFLFFRPTLASERVVVKAEVLEVVSVVSEEIFEDFVSDTQTIRILIKSGESSGQEAEMQNDYVHLEAGDEIYVTEITDEDSITYSLYEIKRTPVLLILLIFFVLLVFVFGGIQGFRGLLSLAGSLALIAFVLLPSILAGHSPVLISVGVASIVIIFGSYVTHGFNRTTSSAVFGMLVTVLFSGIVAYFAIDATSLSGIADDESLYLSMNVGQEIDLIGLLFSGIIIGLLGVLYDTAISQAVAVEELVRISPGSSRTHIYKRALRIGREHIGALVDTLAIAYVGASLPLFLLFYSDNSVSHAVSINNEIFVSEIIRILIGSIGIVLAVPITTFLAVQMLYGRKFKAHAEDAHVHLH